MPNTRKYKGLQLVAFGDSRVTLKAHDLLEKAYAQKTLGMPCVVEFEQDDGEFDTLNTLRVHAEEMGGCVIRLLLGGGRVELVTDRNLGSGNFLVYIP